MLKLMNRKKTLALLVIIILICSSISFFIGLKFKELLLKSDFEEPSENEYIYSYFYKKISFSKPKIVEHKDYFEIKVKNANPYSLGSSIPVYINEYNLPFEAKILNISYKHLQVKTIHVSKKVIYNKNIMQHDTVKKSFSLEENSDNVENNQNKFYPEKWWSYRLGGGILNNNHTTFLSVYSYPVRYNSEKNIIQYIEKAEVTVRYKTAKKSGIFETKKYDLLVITPSKFYQSLQPLVEHKKSVGIKTKIATLEEIYNNYFFPNKGRDDQEKIKYFIKQSMENWGIKYVLLMGGNDEIPVRNRHIVITGLSAPYATDLYYADVYDANGSFCDWDANNNDIFGEYNWEYNSDQMDFYPDLYLGRLPCENAQEVKNVVDKIIHYETTTYGEELFKNFIVCAGDTQNSWKYFKFFRDMGLGILDAIKLGLAMGIDVKEGEYIGNRIAENMTDFKFTKLYASQIIPWKNQKLLTKRNIIKEIEKGAGFVLFSGHGNIDRWFTYKPFLKRERPFFSGFKIEDVAKIKNKNKLPIVFLDACLCGSFYSGECLAWSFIKSMQGGAVATYAYTTTSLMSPLKTQILSNWNGYIAIKFFQSYMEGKSKTGELWAEVLNLYLNQHHRLTSQDYYVIESLQLFGDPSLKIGGCKIEI